MALPQPCKEIKYHWPLNNTEVKGTDTLTGWKFKVNFWLSKSLITASLPLTESLTDNMAD